MLSLAEAAAGLSASVPFVPLDKLAVSGVPFVTGVAEGMMASYGRICLR